MKSPLPTVNPVTIPSKKMGKDFGRKNKTKVAMMGITKSTETRKMVYLSM